MVYLSDVRHFLSAVAYCIRITKSHVMITSEASFSFTTASKNRASFFRFVCPNLTCSVRRTGPTIGISQNPRGPVGFSTILTILGNNSCYQQFVAAAADAMRTARPAFFRISLVYAVFGTDGRNACASASQSQHQRNRTHPQLINPSLCCGTLVPQQGHLFVTCGRGDTPRWIVCVV